MGFLDFLLSGNTIIIIILIAIVIYYIPKIVKYYAKWKKELKDATKNET